MGGAEGVVWITEHCEHGKKARHWWPERADANVEPGWWVRYEYRCKHRCRGREHTAEEPRKVFDLGNHEVPRRVIPPPL